jgi:hypothetical protein
LYKPVDLYTDDELRSLAHDHGIDPDQHCCLRMAAYIGLGRRVAHQVPVLIWVAPDDEYRIGVGSDQPENPPEWRWSRELINYCPWCGSSLPTSRHQEWLDELTRRGFVDPGNEEIPEEFTTDAWWRN